MDVDAFRLFSTPVCRVSISGSAELNGELLDAIDGYHAAHPPDDRIDAWQVVNGWEIGPQFFEEFKDVPAAATLRRTFEEATLTYINADHMVNDFELPKQAVTARVARSWATILHSDAFLSDEHTHQNAHFVGVYYVEVPHMEGPPAAGSLVLRDPRTAMHVIRLRSQKVVELITPEVGTMVIVPAYVAHGVRPFKTDGRRVSINCNILIDETAFLDQ